MQSRGTKFLISSILSTKKCISPGKNLVNSREKSGDITSWPKRGCPKIWAAALEALHPLELLSQNIQIAFLAQPFLGSAWFVTAKYCQTKYCQTKFGASRVAAWNLHHSGGKIKNKWKPDAWVEPATHGKKQLVLSTPYQWWVPGFFWAQARLGDSADPVCSKL